MKINLWSSNDSIAIRDISYKNNKTNFWVDIKFRAEDKTYHIIQQFVDLCDWDRGPDGRTIYHVGYSRVGFDVNAVDLSHKEITNILVNFLAHYKLYLHHFSITKQETYVSYQSPKAESNKDFDLVYMPANRQESIFIDAEVQLEDNTDYYKLLDIKTKEPFESVSSEKLEELGYAFSGYGIHSFIILSDKDAKNYLG